MFTTNLHDDTYKEEPEVRERIRDYRGHIVVRVLPGGDSFYVYMLDDTDLECKVRSIYGPYECR